MGKYTKLINGHGGLFCRKIIRLAGCGEVRAVWSLWLFCLEGEMMAMAVAVEMSAGVGGRTD